MTPLRALGAIGIAGTLVFCMGRCSGLDGADPSGTPERLPVPTVTETVQGATKTVTKYKTPDSCVKALENLNKIIKASSALADAGNPQLDIMSGAHEAIAGKDFQRLVTLQEDQNKLNDKTVEHVKVLELDLLPYYRQYEKECRASAK